MLDYEAIREFAEEIIANYDRDGMEAILLTDGSQYIRPVGYMNIFENKIMVKIPLGQAYWRDSNLWGEDLEKEQVLKETALDALIEDIYSRIEDWQEQEEERKKMKAYFEEERKALEDMIGF